jgi:hypothetical protein
VLSAGDPAQRFHAAHASLVYGISTIIGRYFKGKASAMAPSRALRCLVMASSIP